jgi:acetyl esterase/lipase
MRPWVVIPSMILTLSAALAAALILVPAPQKQLAFLAIVIDEKAFLVIVVAVLGALLAWAAYGPANKVAPTISLVFAALALGIALIPPVQAIQIAHDRNVPLDLWRYVTAPIDIAPARPDQTLSYATIDGETLSLDVYRPPAGWSGSVPAVIVIHGGGWSSGDKGETPLSSQRIAAAGLAVFDIQYRLAPKHNWLAAVGDVKCAIGWVKQRSKEAGVNVDPGRITLLGRSAGGHLALLAAYAADDPALPPSCPAGDTHVESVVAFYAPTDLLWSYEHPTNPNVYDSSERLRWFLGGTPNNAADNYAKASITNRVTPQSPRTLLIHGAQDQFVHVNHVELLKPKLVTAHVSHDALIIPYGQHGFDYVVGGLAGQITEAVLLRFLTGNPNR